MCRQPASVAPLAGAEIGPEFGRRWLTCWLGDGRRCTISGYALYACWSKRRLHLGITASPDVTAAYWSAQEATSEADAERAAPDGRAPAAAPPDKGQARLELLTGPLPLWLAEEVLADIQARPLALRLFPMAPIGRLLLHLRCRAALRRRGEVGSARAAGVAWRTMAGAKGPGAVAAPATGRVGAVGDAGGGGGAGNGGGEHVGDAAGNRGAERSNDTAGDVWDVVGSIDSNDWDSPQLPRRAELAAGHALLAGRMLLESEVRRLLEERGGGQIEADPIDLLEGLVLSGRVRRRAAVHRDRMHRWRCRRCGTVDRVDIGPCARCGRDACAACTECARLGTARACEAIVYSEGMAQRAGRTGGSAGNARAGRTAVRVARQLPGEAEQAGGEQSGAEQPVAAERARASAVRVTPLLQLDFQLSPAQQAAADALLDGDERDALVWAACGAGKTEVVFGVIEKALHEGGPVLFAVPRRDVVIELEGRLQKAFPSVPVKAIYGGSPTRFPDVPLVIATTHQVMRFYRQFRLVVLDEVDAYPYWGSRMLRRAVSRATIAGGRTICLTATPPEVLLEKARRGEWRLITIPARHHGYPLPEPVYLLDAGLERVRQNLLSGRRRVSLPRIVVETVQEAVRQPDPLLVFVPAVDLVAPTARLLDRVCRSGAAPGADALPLAFGVHSRDPRRDAVRDAFSRGEFPILVATTVLERGITVPGVNVLVMWADAEGIFDSASLMQMAGRAGRTADRPHGRVWFAASRKNRAMQIAAHRIAALNEEARRCGYLR